MATILVIEDDEDLADIWVELLGELGHRVAWAGSLAALRALDTEAADLVVVDWTLPDGSGDEVLAWIAAQPWDPAVVVTTGHGSATVAASDDGVDAVLRKPFKVRELLAVVDRLASS